MLSCLVRRPKNIGLMFMNVCLLTELASELLADSSICFDGLIGMNLDDGPSDDSSGIPLATWSRKLEDRRSNLVGLSADAICFRPSCEERETRIFGTTL